MVLSQPTMRQRILDTVFVEEILVVLAFIAAWVLLAFLLA